MNKINPIEFTEQAGIEDDELLCVRCWQRPRRKRDGDNDPSRERNENDPLLCEVCDKEAAAKREAIRQMMAKILLQKQQEVPVTCKRNHVSKESPVSMNTPIYEPYEIIDGREIMRGAFQQVLKW